MEKKDLERERKKKTSKTECPGGIEPAQWVRHPEVRARY